MNSSSRSSKIKDTFHRVVRSASALVLIALPAAVSVGCARRTNEVQLFKMGGDIDLDAAPDGAELTTMGGNIHLGSAGGPSELKTMGGNIEVDSASASLKATTMAGNLVIHMTDKAGSGRSQEIELKSNSGQISLFLPQNFGATVDLTLAYTNNQQSAFEILDDLGLQQTRTNEWDRFKGTPRKYIHATGRIGDGRNRIIINTINGNIKLQRKSSTT